jgi:hypothetical protein
MNALSAISTMSLHTARLQPSPTAGPFTAATTGSGKSIISVSSRRAPSISPRRCSRSSHSSTKWCMSPPALNALPAPVSTAARASVSEARCRHTATSAACSALLVAFIASGRLSVTTRIGPLASISNSGSNGFSIGHLPSPPPPPEGASV